MNAPAVPPFAQLQAPPGWRTVDFISDLHLQGAHPETFDAWRAYMGTTPADALFILGDLFDAWAGDDTAAEPGFEADCAAVLKSTAARLPLFFMHGNRDFLVGQEFARATGTALLQDPTVLVFLEQRWLLTHGDALCLRDTEYLAFRHQVRATAWQSGFLARPRAERRSIAQGLRQQSEARKQSGAPDADADVDDDAAVAWLEAAGARVMIHGHTHRPADHDLGGGLRRVVLTDWDAAAASPRLQVLRLGDSGPQRIAFS